MTDESERERYSFAQALARKAGALAHDYFRNRERLTVELKGPQDFVSHADRDVDRYVRDEVAVDVGDDQLEQVVRFRLAANPDVE